MVTPGPGVRFSTLPPIVRCLTTRPDNFGQISRKGRQCHEEMETIIRKLYVSAFEWWFHYSPIVPTVYINEMLSLISNTSEVTTTGGETVTMSCGVLYPLPRTHRDYLQVFRISNPHLARVS